MNKMLPTSVNSKRLMTTQIHWVNVQNSLADAVETLERFLMDRKAELWRVEKVGDAGRLIDNMDLYQAFDILRAAAAAYPPADLGVFWCHMAIAGANMLKAVE